MAEPTTIPLSFDSKGLQKQLDEISGMMNKSLGSFGGKGHFKSISSAMNSFKTSFGSINKSLNEVNGNLTSLSGSINSIVSGLDFVDTKVQKINKNIGTTKLDAVKKDITEVRQSLDKPVNLKVQLSETDIVKPLEAQLVSANRKINEALKTKELTSGKIDTSEFSKSARSVSDLFTEIERTVKSKTKYVSGTIRDLVREERNSVDQLGSLFRQNVNILESFKATREPVKLPTMTGFEAGPIATMLDQVNNLRMTLKDISLGDAFTISSTAINPLHELVKTLFSAGIELRDLKQLGRSFVIDIDGTKVDALEGNLKDLSKVAGTDVAKAFNKITNSKLVTQDVWSKVFEASDIVSFNKALVELESKLEKAGRKSKNVKAIHNNFAEIKQLAETHFAAKMSEEFEQGATKSERKIGGLYKTITKLHSLIQAGKVPETALVKPYKLLSKELQSMLGDARNFDLALNKITSSTRDQQDASMVYRPGKKGTESAQQEMYGFRQGLEGIATVDLNTIQVGLERIMIELRNANSELGVAQASWVSWGEVSKKAIIDLRKVAGTFEVPGSEKVALKFPDVEAAKVAKLKEYRAELEKLGRQRSELVKKQQIDLPKITPTEEAVPYKKIVDHLNLMTGAYKKQSIAILTKSQALQQSIDLEGRSATEKEEKQLNKLEKEFVEVANAEKQMNEASKTVFNTLNKLSKQKVFSSEDTDSIMQMVASMEKFKSVAGGAGITSGLEKIKTILREAIPEPWNVSIKPTIAIKEIDKQMAVLRNKLESAAIVAEPPTKTIEVTAYDTMKSTRSAMTSLNKQIAAMSKSAKIAIQNIKMDDALDPKAIVDLMKPLEGLLHEFDLVQQDLKLIDEALIKVGANPSEETMKKTWAELEPVIKRAYKSMNNFSGAYKTITKEGQEATSIVRSFSLQLGNMMQQPDKAAAAFKRLSNSLLQSIGIADEAELAKRLKSPNKQIRKDAEELTRIISSAQKKLATVSKEAISLKPGSAEASIALSEWDKIIMKLVSSFGQGGIQAQQRFLEAYQSKAKGFKFDTSLFTSSMKLEKLLKRLGMTFKTLGARSGDILPLGEFDQLIKRMSELEKMSALGTVATKPIIELKNVVAGTVNVFDKMKLAIKASSPPEVIQSIQKEIDAFLQLKKDVRDASEEKKQLGATQGNLGLLTELAIKYLTKETTEFQRLGKAAHTALGKVKSGMAGQAGMFQTGLKEIEGPIFKLDTKGGFELAGELSSMFGKLHSNTSESMSNLRTVTEKSLTGWSIGFKKGFDKTDNVVKQNGTVLSRNLNQIKKSIMSASDFRWEELLDPEGVEVMKKSALNAGLQIGDLQKRLARFGVGKEKGVTSFPTIKALQTQLKTVLSVSEEVERKIGTGELGVEHFPAVDRLRQYAAQLTAAIDMIQKPYESVKGLSKKEKVSSKSLGKAFRAGVYRASDQLKDTVKQIKQPMRSVMVRLFEDVFSMDPTEINKAGGMIRNLTERFPAQVKSALSKLGKSGIDLSKHFSKMFEIDLKSFATVEQAAAAVGAKIPKMLLKVMFPTEGQAKFAVEAKKMANQMISTPMNSALKSAVKVVSPEFEKFGIGEHMLRAAKFDGEKFVKIKSEYRGYILDLLKDITQVMRTSPSKTMRPLLEKIFDPQDAQRVGAYSNAMKGVLGNLQSYLKKTLSGKLPKDQQMMGLGLMEEMKSAGLDFGDEDVAQNFSKMYEQAGRSLKDFIAKEEKWSGDSVRDLMNLIEYWENLGQMIKLVTGKIPAVSGVKNISEIMFKKETLGAGAVGAGRSMAITMVKSLNATLESGTGIKKPLAAMIGKDPSVIFEVLRSGSQKLKNELGSLGFKLRGSTSDMLKSINKLSGARVDTAWFEQYRMENERFYFEGKKTAVAIERIIQGFKLIKPGDSAALTNTIIRSEDLLKRASLSYESFMNGLYKHTSKFSTYGDVQRANMNKFTNILAGGMRTIAQFYQEDPFEKGVTRLVRGEEFLWEKLIAVADKGGKKLKISIQSELAKAIEPGKREGINLDRLFKGTGKVPEIQQIIGQLREVRKITNIPIDVPAGTRPFSQIIKSTSKLENFMLSTFGSITSGLQRVGKTGKVDIQMKGSIEDLNNMISHLEILQKEIEETNVHAKKTGKELPTSFHIVARSVAEMSSSVHSALDVFKKIPTSANVSEKELKELSNEVYKSASALKKFDQIDLRTFSDQMGYALTNAMHKVRQFSRELAMPKGMRLEELRIGELMKTGDSDKIIQSWRKMQKQGGDTWKQMVVMLESLEPEFKGIFEKFAGKPRLLLKAFDKMTPQMKVLMSMFFNEMGHSTSAGFNEWMNSFNKYFSGMTKTNSRHLETFLGNTSKVMAAFKSESKFVMPDMSQGADKSAEGMKRLGTALASLGINMKELKALSGDLSWLNKWAEALKFKVEWDFGPDKGPQMISLTGVFNMFGKALTLVGEGLDKFVTQLHRLGTEGGTEKTQQGIKQLVNMIRMLDTELGKTSKQKLSLGSSLSESIKPLRDIGFALNNFFDGMEKIKNSAAFTLTEKEVKQFAGVVVRSMGQILTAFKPAIAAMSRFSESLGVKRFSMFAQGMRDLIVATKELHQLSQIFGEVAKSSDKGAGALTHFKSAIQAMLALLTSFPEIASKLTFGVDKNAAENMEKLVTIIIPLSRAMKELGSAFKKGDDIGAKITKFGENLKRLVSIIRGIDLDVATHDIINDLHKLTKIFSSSMMELPAKQAAEHLNRLSNTVKTGTKSVAQNVKKGVSEIKNATKDVDKDFFADFGDLFEGGEGGIVPLTGFADAGEPMAHLSSAGSEVTGVLQLLKGALDKLSKEFIEIIPEEEKFFKGLQKLAAANPAAAVSALSQKLGILDKKLGEEGLKKSRDAIQRFIVELTNGSDAVKSLGSSKIELEKIHSELDKGSVSAKKLTQAMSKIQGVIRGAEHESAKLDLQNRLLKTRGEAKSVHAEMKGLLTTMKRMGPELKRSLSTSESRREFFSYMQEMQAKLHTAMTPMRAYTGFKGVDQEIQQMSRSIVQMKSQSRGLLTLADRFTGKLRTAGDQFLNLVAYQTRWYVSQQIFFMGLGQVERILSNFGELDKQVRRVLRVLRDSNFAVLGVESSVRALAGAGNKLAKDWAKSMEVMFKSQIQNTFYNLFRELGASAEEIGESLYQLGDAGLNVNEVISAIEPTLRMVIATEGEARETTKLIAGIFNLYGDSIEGARSNTEKFVHITDVLTAVFRDHMLEINELVSGMGYVIATAKLSGMQFEEVAAALGILNDNMLKGSKAGRAFNRMLLNSTKDLGGTKAVLQTIATQVGDIDLTEIFAGLDKSSARPFDYIIQAGIAMHEKLKTSSLTVNSLAEMFKTMGVVGARAFAILLLKAKDYERTLFQLQYASFSAGEDMSKLLVGSFERSMHKIEGFTRAGYARISGMVKGAVKVLAQSAEHTESKLRKLSDISIVPDVSDIKSFVAFFSLLITAQAILLGLGKKGLPGLGLFRFDKLLGSLNNVVTNTKVANIAFKTFDNTLKTSSANAYSLSGAYEKMSDSLTRTAGPMSKFTMITKSLSGNLRSLTNKQRFVVSGLVDIEKAFTKVAQGKWSTTELTHFMDKMKQLKEFTPTFAAREQEFKIRTDMSKLLEDLRRGGISVKEFSTQLASIQKKTIEVSGIPKLVRDLDILEAEFKNGVIKIDEYRNRLKLLSLEASTAGKVKVLGLDRFSEKSYASAFSGIRKASTMLNTNFTQMSKIGITGMDDVHRLIRDPKSWNALNDNVSKSYSSWDRQTQQTSNKFMKLMTSMAEAKTPIRKAMLESSKLEGDLVNRAKRVSASGAIIGGFWSGFSSGAAGKVIPFFKNLKDSIFDTTRGLAGLDSTFNKAVARENALTNLRVGFTKLGTAVRGAAKAIGKLGSSIMSMFVYTFIFQKVFEIIEKLSRGTEYWAAQIGRVNSEFNKAVSSLTGNISGIVKYANKLDEIRKSLNVKMKAGIEIDSEGIRSINQEMIQLKLLLEGNQELSDFSFNIESGDVVSATKSWERLNSSIKNLVEETSDKAIGRFIELGSEFERANKTYMKTIETAMHGSLMSRLTNFGTREATLKITSDDFGSADKIKFKNQGMEAAKLILDAAKTTLQFGAKTFEFQWNTKEIAEVTSQLDIMADSVFGINDNVTDSDKLFKDFIFSLNKNLKSSKILERFEMLSKSINKVFAVEGAEKLQTFMSLFPNLTEKSKEEVQKLAKSWATLGEDKRAVLLMRAAHKDLVLFNEEMKKSTSVNMFQNAESSEKFVSKAVDDISKLNSTISQLGGVAAVQFERDWDRSWSSWIESGVSATINMKNALAGTFEFGAMSNLGKVERAIYNTTKPIVKGFIKAYTEIGDKWDIEVNEMFDKNKLPKLFEPWRNELTIALQGPWASAQAAQNEWKSGVDNSVASAMQKFNLLQNLMVGLGNTASTQWKRINRSSKDVKIGTKKDGEDGMKEFNDGVEKSLKEAIKSGQKEIKGLAQAMSKDVSGAIDKSIQRLTKLNEVIAKAQSLSIKVKKAIDEWAEGFKLSNKLIEVSLSYLRKFSESSKISKFVQEIEFGALRKAIDKATETFERAGNIGSTYEDKLKSTEKYSSDIISSNEKITDALIKMVSKVIEKNSKAETDAIEENHKAEMDAENESHTNQMKRFGDVKKKEGENQDRISRQEKRLSEAHERRKKELEEDKRIALESRAAGGGGVSDELQNLVKRLGEIKVGEGDVEEVQKALNRFSPEIAKEAKPLFNMLAGNQTKLQEAYNKTLEIGEQAQKQEEEVRESIQSLIKLKENFDKYAKTTIEQGKVITEILKRGGVSEAIQALSALGLDIKLDEDLKLSPKSLGVLDKAMNQLSFAADTLQKTVYPSFEREISLEAKPTSEPKIMSEIAKNFKIVFESLESSNLSVQTQFLAAEFVNLIDKMSLTGKTQKEIDASMQIVNDAFIGLKDNIANAEIATTDVEKVAAMVKVEAQLNELEKIFASYNAQFEGIDFDKVALLKSVEETFAAVRSLKFEITPEIKTEKDALSEAVDLFKQQLQSGELEKNTTKYNNVVSNIKDKLNELNNVLEIYGIHKKFDFSEVDIGQVFEKLNAKIEKTETDVVLDKISNSGKFTIDAMGNLQTATVNFGNDMVKVSKIVKKSYDSLLFKMLGKESLKSQEGQVFETTAGKPMDIKVLRVKDGDTLVAENINGAKIVIRTAYVDAPEMGQVGGVESKRGWENLINEYQNSGFQIQAAIRETDRGRAVTSLTAIKDGQNIDLIQLAVLRGIAQVATEIVPNLKPVEKPYLENLFATQKIAQENLAGLHGFTAWLNSKFKDTSVTRPSEYRGDLAKAIKEGNLITIQTMLKNEASLKQLFNEFLSEQGKAPVYGKEELTITAQKVTDISNGVRTGISTYDTKVETSLDKISNNDLLNKPLLEIILDKIAEAKDTGIKEKDADVKDTSADIEQTKEQTTSAAESVAGLYEQATAVGSIYTHDISSENILKQATIELSNIYSILGQTSGIESVSQVPSKIDDAFQLNKLKEIIAQIRSGPVAGSVAGPVAAPALEVISVAMPEVEQAQKEMGALIQAVNNSFITLKDNISTASTIDFGQFIEAADIFSISDQLNRLKETIAQFNANIEVTPGKAQKEIDALMQIVNDAFIGIRDSIVNVETATSDFEQFNAAGDIFVQLDDLREIIEQFNADIGAVDSAESTSTTAKVQESLGTDVGIIKEHSIIISNSITELYKQSIIELNNIYSVLEQTSGNENTNQVPLGIEAVLLRFDTALNLASIELNMLSSGLSNTENETNNFGKALSNSSNSLGNAFSSLRSSASSASSALASIKRMGARTGTVLPGYGGGDHIPYDLEPGEAVINKEAVRMFGRDLFQAYNIGKANPIGRPVIGQKLKGARSFIEKKVLPNDSPIRKFDINLGGIPFEGLATEDMINQLQRGLKRKQLVGQNR